MTERKEVEISLSLLIKIYKKNIKFIASSMAVLMTAIVIYGFIAPREYEAVATVLPPKQDGGSGGLSSFLQSMSGSISIGGIGQGNQSQLFYEIIKSRSAAELIEKECKLSSKPQFKDMSKEQLYKMISDMIDVSVERSGVLTITSYMSTGWFASAQELKAVSSLNAQITNSAINALDYLVRHRSVSAAKQSRMYIERELLNYKVKLDSVEEKFEVFQKQNKVLKIEEQTQALLKQAIDVGLELAKAESELNLLVQEYSSNSQIVKQAKNNVEFLRTQYSNVQNGGLTGDEDFSMPIGNIPSLSRIYSNLFRDRKIYEQVITYLETQRHQEAIQENKDLPVVEALDRAIASNTPSAPSKKMIVLLGFILSLALVLSYVTFKEYNAGKFNQS